MSDRDEVAEVLAAHAFIGTLEGPCTCRCENWQGDRDGGRYDDQHGLHVADALLDSDWLARREAEARAAGVEEVRRRCEALADEWEARQNGRVRGFGARLRTALAARSDQEAKP